MPSVETNIDSSVDYHDTWIVDSGSTSHMTGKYGVFHRIEEIAPEQFVETDIGNPQAEIRGVRTVKFQLDLGNVLEVNRVLFVPGMKVSRLSMSSLEDDGYGMFVKSEQMFLYQVENPVGTTILLGNRRDRLYFLQGEVMFPGSSGWLSETEFEDESVDAHMIPSDEESYTGRRLSQYEGCEQRQDNSQIIVVFRHGSPGHILEQEGASSEDRDPGG